MRGILNLLTDTLHSGSNIHVEGLFAVLLVFTAIREKEG